MTVARLDIPLAEGPRMIAGILAAAGHDVVIVGGTVRDVVLGRRLGDADLATNASVEEIRALLEPVSWVDAIWDAGARWGTIGVAARGGRVEITRFREHAEVAPDAASRFAIDAQSRDLTINAVGVLLPDSELLDPVGGLADIEARVLRAPGDPRQRFSQDPLRVLRLGRFAAELCFETDPATVDAAALVAPRLVECAGERIHNEIWRLLDADCASRGLDLLRRVGALDVVLPEADTTDVALATVDALPTDPERRLAAMLSHLTKVRLASVCERLRCSRAQTRRIWFFVDHGLGADPDHQAVAPLGGNAIIAELGVSAGPMVGMVKSALAAAVSDGLLDPNDREGALRLARGILGTTDPDEEEHER